MKSKNWIIVALIVIVIALGYFLLKDKDSANQAANTQQQNQTPPPAPNPVPSELPTPSPEPTPTPVPNPTPSSFKETFAEYNWLVTDVVVDGKVADFGVNTPAPMTLNFDMSKKGYSGFGGCNNYSGTYKASATDNFSFGATAATKKACVDSSNLESQLFNAMGKVTKFKIQSGKLILTSPDGKTSITYVLAV